MLSGLDRDQWLGQAGQVGRRHHRVGKNRTDGVSSTPLVAFRYLVPLIVPVTATLRPFLARSGRGPDEVERMYSAWLKSVLLQVTLWSHPYVREGDY